MVGPAPRRTTVADVIASYDEQRPKSAPSVENCFQGALSLRKLDGKRSMDARHLDEMWTWMVTQPGLYRRNYGFYRVADILNPDIPINYYGLFHGDSLIAVISLVLESKGVCHFGLTCPPRPRFRAIIPLIEEFRRAFFDEYGGLLLYISVPPDTHPISHRLAAMLGCQRVSAERWEYSLYHHLTEQNGINRPESL